MQTIIHCLLRNFTRLVYEVSKSNAAAESLEIQLLTRAHKLNLYRESIHVI